MGLNLIADPWIPVIRDGVRAVIRPAEIADRRITRPAWPRADLNLACLELLIGLIYLARPPAGLDDWLALRDTPPDLDAALAQLAPAFDLIADGPAFLQDFDALAGEPDTPDMLFIDGAGDKTVRDNADLMVRHGRYPALELPMAAMALYTLQAWAPSGGQGHRTSMRGGGPMVTFVRPERPALWDLIWANVPAGRPVDPRHLAAALPWMRPTRTSEAGEVVHQPPGDQVPPEVFFGMPRRIRLVAEARHVTGVIQKNRGTNYGQWEHPLTPYYAQKAGGEWFARHPKPGLFGYRDWVGVVLPATSETVRRAQVVRLWDDERAFGESADLLVGGWAMSNARPLDFIWSEPPFYRLSEKAAMWTEGFVAAAGHAADALRLALRAALSMEKSPLDALIEEFWRETQTPFEARVAGLARGADPQSEARHWLAVLRRAVLVLFDRAALPVLDVAEIAPRESGAVAGQRPSAHKIVEGRRRLAATLAGYERRGVKLFRALGLELPTPRKKEELA